jgi:hypothetical protein
MSQSRLVLICLAAGLLSSSIVACGDDEKASSSSPNLAAASDGAVPPNIITEQDVNGQKQGSPGRAVLMFGQAIQFSDSDGVATLVTPEALTRLGGRTRLDKAVGFMGAGFSRVTIAATQPVDDSHARVRAWLSTYDSTGKRTAYNPTTFAMAKVDGQWKVDDLTLVSRTLRDFEALERSER